MRVKVRQEGEKCLAYFIDSRRLIEVNAMGAMILDQLLNQNMSRDAIAQHIADQFSVDQQTAKRDIAAFCDQIKQELRPNGFNVIEQTQLTMPLGVELEITLQCNLRCRHCFQTYQAQRTKFMPTTQATAIITQLADSGIFEVSLMGGEPFTHPGLWKILNCCRSLELAVNVVTNATLITEQSVQQLAVFPRTVMIVSLDGTQQIHDYIRGQGVFAKVDTTLRLLRDYHIPVEITCTLNSVNLPIYLEVVEYCRQLDIPCNFNLFKPFTTEQRALVADPSMFFDAITHLLQLRRQAGYQVGLSNAAIVSEVLGLSPRNECRATRSGLVIDVNGRMITCPSLAAAGYYQDGGLPMFDRDFLETWQRHPAFTSFRSNGLKECQARAYIFSGHVQGFDPYGISAFRVHMATKKDATHD